MNLFVLYKIVENCLNPVYDVTELDIMTVNSRKFWSFAAESLYSL